MTDHQPALDRLAPLFKRVPLWPRVVFCAQCVAGAALLGIAVGLILLSVVVMSNW